MSQLMKLLGEFYGREKNEIIFGDISSDFVGDVFIYGFRKLNGD